MKTRKNVKIDFDIENVEPKPLITEEEQKNIRNIYTFEEELRQELEKTKIDFEKMAQVVVEFETYETEDSDILLIAHGIVGSAALAAVEELRKRGKKVGLFRPITLSPFPKIELNRLAEKNKKIFVVESSLGQLRDIVKQNLEKNLPVDGLYKPAVGIEIEEILKPLE